jgi:hypothetical protein
MNKKALIIILLLFFLLRKTKGSPTPPDNDSEDSGIYSGSYKWTYYRVKSGDTLYKIARVNIPLEKAKEKYKGSFDGEGNPLDTEKNLILMYARQLAESNGFDWTLYDSKPSVNLRDPDTLKPNQKLILWSWESFRANDETGFLLPYSQYIEFGTWTPSPDAPENIKQAFARNPPQ